MERIMFPLYLGFWDAQRQFYAVAYIYPIFSDKVISRLTYILTHNSCFKDLFQLCFMLFPLQTLWEGDEGIKKDSESSGA